MHLSTIIVFILSLSSFTCINYATALQTENIIGGLPAKAENFKYQCVLMVFNIHRCACGILNNDYVITAAHCVANNKAEFIDLSYEVWAGIDNLRNKDLAIKTKVEKAYIHKDYKGFLNDIAILKVKSSFNAEKNKQIGFLKLPENENVYKKNIGKEALVAGFGWDKVYPSKEWKIFGKKKTYGTSSRILNYGRVELISKQECERNTRGLEYYVINDNVICGHSKPKTLQDAAGVCAGDSGSPLVTDGNTVLGIVNYNPGNCDDSSRAAVFIKVLSYKRFVNDVKSGKGSKDAKLYNAKGVIKYSIQKAIELFCPCVRGSAVDDPEAVLTLVINHCPCAE